LKTLALPRYNAAIMFTGLVEVMGTVRQRQGDGTGMRLGVEEPKIAADAPLGASVAVNGVCLTVIERDDTFFVFEIGPETLRCTNLGELRPGDRVNLERSLRVGDRLGGHIVQGHVDGIGHVLQRERQADWDMVWFSCDPGVRPYLVRKGSITVDGVSLTVVDVKPDGFSVALIPHTLEMTTLGFKQPGATVNLETDIFARMVVSYLEQLPIAEFQ
jgi:riboflavin synthase